MLLTRALGDDVLLCAAAVLRLACLVGRAKIHEKTEIELCRSIVHWRSLHNNVWRWEAVSNSVCKEVAVVFVELRNLAAVRLGKRLSSMLQLQPGFHHQNPDVTHIYIESLMEEIMAAYPRPLTSSTHESGRPL